MRAVTVALIAAAPIVIVGLFFSEPASAAPLPSCTYEDGNEDGQPCMWTDPDTGRRYIVDSENYR